MGSKNEFLREQQIADDITGIVAKEVKRIKGEAALGIKDLASLEKCSKIYTMIMASHREDIKAGLFGTMPQGELEELSDET